jgi:protein O-mannosyl-transferase
MRREKRKWGKRIWRKEGNANKVVEESPIRPFERRDWILAAALVAAVFLAYQPAWNGGFVWDDDTHLLNNPVLKPGGLAKIWRPGGYLNYWPLTCTAYWLQAQMWGLNPIGYHLVNIALHCISALLVWRILERLGLPGALFAAAIFALHPVNVESVAWITQLKNVLSLLLAVVSAYFFLAHENRGGWWRYALALAAFFLSTLSKGMVITLPLVLLACAWWQRGRITRRDLLRVLPYFVIGAVMAGVEVWGQQFVGSDENVRGDDIFSRTATAGCAVWFYLGKLLWPLDLSFVYPRWQIDERNPLYYLPGVLLVIALGLAWRQRMTWGWPVVMLIVCYVALLLPALGFVNVYFMRFSLVADHYQYAATIVPAAALAAAAATLGRRCRFPAWIAYGLGVGLLAILAGLTWSQCRIYADAETLYRETIKKNPDCWMAHNNLGNLLTTRRKFAEAEYHCRRALEIKSDLADAHYNLGVALAGTGRVDEAIEHYQEALKIKFDYVEALNKVAWLRATYHDGKYRNGSLAVKLAKMAEQMAPDDADTLNTLAAAYAEVGKYPLAVESARHALKLAKQQYDQAMIESIQGKIRLYESGKPFHEQIKK